MPQTAKKTTFKRYKRTIKKPSKRIEIQPRDIEIFKSLAEHRFLDSQHILALHPLSGGGRYHQRRLQHLFHHSYIDRPPSQMSYYRVRNHMIYALGRKGADVIYANDPERRGRIDWQQKNHEVKFPFLAHALMIADFRVALTGAIKQSQNTELVQWQQGKELRDTVSLKGRKLAVVPDAFFTIKKDGGLYNFFLEADRSTMVLERVIQKITAYWRWKEEGRHEKRFNIQRFRVLFITISEERKENIRKIAKNGISRAGGYPMFLFACEKNYDFTEPATILKPIWQSPADENRQGMFK